MANQMLNRRQMLPLLAAPALAPGAPPPSRPNILFIMSDDHASHAISAYGSRINQTPNIDRLAKEGVRLENCFCTNSICTPSRGAILTGQYSHRNGVYTLGDPLDRAKPNVAKYLQAAGYQTAMIGKWHLHQDPAGFDYWNILPGQGLYHDPVFIEKGERKKHTGYCTDLIGDFTLNWLKQRDASKPFFLMCHHKAPHRAWQPPARYQDWLANVTVPEPPTLLDNYETRSKGTADAKMKVGPDSTKTDLKTTPPPGLTGDALRKWAYQLYIKDYLRCVRAVDDNVGRVLDYLDTAGLTQNTLVIYTSDQGFFLGDHGFYDKRFMYEESLRMPFLARWPGVIRPGAVEKRIALNIDFAPAFLEAAGAKPAPEMQGRSLLPLLTGKKPREGWRSSMYYRYWMHLADHYVPAHYGVRTDRYKLIYFYGQPLGKSGAVDKPTPPEWEFYDLKTDPRELRNLYGDPAHAKTIESLKKELAKLQKDYGDEPA